VIKYLGSKRWLVPALGELWAAAGAARGLDLFTGTTRVAQEWKRRGGHVVAVDRTRAAHLFARCYVEADARDPALAPPRIAAALAELDALAGEDGYVSEVFARRARYFQPANAARIDAVRRAIAERWAGTPLEPVLLTALVEAADRVDSTTGVQMAYLKSWAPRARRSLQLQPPALLPGGGAAVLGDAEEVVGGLGCFDVAYLDPPYNQHRYETNYHVWETLVAGDEPDHYGVACKRTDLRDPAGRSAFNSRRTLPAALATVVGGVQADVVALSGSADGWVGLDELVALCEPRGYVAVLSFPARRYVGATIGVHSPTGERVGVPGRLHTTEHLVVSGSRDAVARALGRRSRPLAVGG
jgi:adenine-specific DNA-methyltransferase